MSLESGREVEPDQAGSTARVARPEAGVLSDGLELPAISTRAPTRTKIVWKFSTLVIYGCRQSNLDSNCRVNCLYHSVH
ncbi:hypothetical protein MPTK1_2g20560 [Marchantia polymorpha subsp. ruderalis]|uniref:Uncharacterized protein n=1 Tax=Marchantia polymorpha TaxID=3197 RepID=A0A2R6VYQ1_MARPO|nr:hypothetical protein MARPO_0479s0001 [Marchantia polymorpha]BBN03081.1 hypothetical protein Mp_2g20560 [Marchantia polymorpha subsp. ruderalis]|eukprot:PTQ26745.1 hypothetical protein MARPO_0479s0001 [Marchantia polymorpha]